MTRVHKDVESIAAAAHDKWCEDHEFKPRWKILEDGSSIDIANTPFADLPNEWREENIQGAISAIYGLALYNDIESVAAYVHAEWVQRNRDCAPPELLVPYDDLTEEDKEKDRLFVRLVLEMS